MPVFTALVLVHHATMPLGPLLDVLLVPSLTVYRVKEQLLYEVEAVSQTLLFYCLPGSLVFVYRAGHGANTHEGIFSQVTEDHAHSQRQK